jgi:hypothetical protein
MYCTQVAFGLRLVQGVCTEYRWSIVEGFKTVQSQLEESRAALNSDYSTAEDDLSPFDVLSFADAHHPLIDAGWLRRGQCLVLWVSAPSRGALGHRVQNCCRHGSWLET